MLWLFYFYTPSPISFMARIKIDIPEKFSATFTIPVRITDLNYGNHVGNDVFVSIIHEARVQWLNQNNFSELNIGGPGLIMRELLIEYKKESSYGDIIQVDISADEITKVSFDLIYQLSTVRDGNTFILANARTGMVSYDYSIKKIMAIPDDFIKILKG
jgi:acyl-CoA thioester hydrolase